MEALSPAPEWFGLRGTLDDEEIELPVAPLDSGGCAANCASFYVGIDVSLNVDAPYKDDKPALDSVRLYVKNKRLPVRGVDLWLARKQCQFTTADPLVTASGTMNVELTLAPDENSVGAAIGTVDARILLRDPETDDEREHHLLADFVLPWTSNTRLPH